MYPELVKLIQDNLTDDLRKKQWRGNSNKLAGHCYVTSEAIYHLLGGKEAGYTPHTVKVDGVVHWFLRDGDGTVIDATAGQFEDPVPYHESRGRGFLTKQPSKRARRLIERIFA
jgi:hypothetical protein